MSVVLVVVALMCIVDVTGLIAMVLMGIALMGRMGMLVHVVVVVVALMRIVDVSGLVTVVFVLVALMCRVLLHLYLLSEE